MIHRANGLAPHQIRAVTFAARRRGLDPEQVYAYLLRVADEMDLLLRDLTTATVEAERMRRALRRGRDRHPDPVDPDLRRHDGGHW